MVHQRKWYVVIVGTEPGVYSSWIEAGPKTRNIPRGAIYQGFLSENEAIRMFEAAKERGEVKAYPDAGEEKSSGKSKNAPLSPLGEEAAWLRTPLGLKEDAESTGPQTQLLSPTTHSRVAKLRRTLRDPTDSCLTSSSPPTNVTQVYAPLYEEDNIPCNTPEGRPSPHFTFTSSSSRTYPVVSDGCLLESGTEEMPFQLEVSDWGSTSPTPSSSDSHPGAEEHTSRPPRCMPLHPEPLPKSKGVEYRSLSDLADTENIDSRIWLPESRVFDPDKVKPRPLTRPRLSPAKKDTSSVPCHKTVGDMPQLRCQISLADTPFVRAGRGRHSRLTPSWSLPILPNRELEDNCSSFGSHPIQPLENHRTGKAKAKEIDYSVCDKQLAERPTEYGPSPRNYGRSHVQLVPRDGKDEQSVIVVHCPPNCPHETCYRRPLAFSVSTIEPSRSTSSRYVDACVSPIIAIPSRIQDTDSPAKIRSKRHLDGDHPCELAGFTHVSHKDIAPETDVRSPFVKGTVIPMNAAEMGRTRWKNASRVRRLACLTRLLALSDLACFSVALAVTVLTHVFWAL